MEYPKMDRDLRLLALMRRQLEEALGLGVEGPRLEYREGPPDLMISVAGVHTVEEIHLGGYYHGHELIEGAGDYLRRLDEGGHVELMPRGSGTGFVRVTASSLEKVRRRQAFEANLPGA